MSEFIDAIEKATGEKAIRNFLPLQSGDVVETWADIGAMESYVDFKQFVSLEEGVKAFVNWYKKYVCSSLVSQV